MATRIVSHILFFSVILSLHTVCFSGTFVGFSYDAREKSPASWSPSEALSLLQNSKYKVFFTSPGEFLDSLPSSGVPIYLCVEPFEARKLLNPKASATSWIRSHVISNLPFVNISRIIIIGSEERLPSALSTLNSLYAALESFGLDRSVKVSAMFSVSALETLSKTRSRDYRGVIEFIKNSESFFFVESTADITALAALPSLDIPLVLNVKNYAAQSVVEISKFSERMKVYIDNHAMLRKRVLGLFMDISNVREPEKEKMSWEEELIFPSSHRELLNHGEDPVSATKTTVHDVYNPVTNPLTTPVTVPSTNPAPAIVTVPSTNPVTVLPTNPTMAPITIPPMNPVTTPITVPATNPMPTPITTPIPDPDPTTTPVTTPVVPITNPATTPTTFPVTSPVTNPVTTYPYTQPGGNPSIAPPVTVPSTVPVSPAVSGGQTWCVAKTGSLDSALQLALDYACGIGGADCSAIQPTGSCYNPNTIQYHASYAFNSYYQKNPTPPSCDFGGAGMLVSVNPSSGTCMYPSSSSISGYNPASTTTGSSTGSTTGTTGTSSGSTVFNTNNPNSNTAFGSNNPIGATSNSFTISAGLTSLTFVLTLAYITGKI